MKPPMKPHARPSRQNQWSICVTPRRSRPHGLILPAPMAVILLVLCTTGLAPAQAGPATAEQVKACQGTNVGTNVGTDVGTDVPAAARVAACAVVIADADQPADVRADAYTVRGSALDEDGRHDEAIDDFNAAQKLVPNDAVALIARGNAYDSKGDKHRAMADYSEAIRVNPGDAAPYYNRGAIHQELGEDAKAIADYKRALEIEPEFDSAKQGLAELAKK